MERKYTILIVDDSKLNRQNLIDVLEPSYEIIEACDGREGLEVLKKNVNRIDLIILDLIMPVLDGYGFLDYISRHSRYKNIPIIIATTEDYLEHEKRCLAYGVWDFIPKSSHIDIIRSRVKNAIERSYFHTLEKNEVSGLYNHLKFFKETEYLLENNPETPYVFIHLDIERFKNINDFYGIEIADQLIKHTANAIFNTLKSINGKCTYGHIIADKFCICLPIRNGEYKKYIEKIISYINDFEIGYKIVVAIGIYEILDNTEQVSSMYDKSISAAKSIKGNYTQHCAYYTREMESRTLWEKTIVNRMEEALKNEEFRVYYQPKYDLKNEKIVAAEALVRWILDDGSVISPLDFIPIFEKNGFITKLDFYVWENVCKFLRRELDRGYDIVPVSVNVSRVNIYDPRFFDKLVDLLEKYKINPKFFKLEITESVFALDYEYVGETIDRLHKMGFIIMMDDFGSGYSSFNMLRDINVDVLKLDMKFL